MALGRRKILAKGGKKKMAGNSVGKGLGNGEKNFIGWLEKIVTCSFMTKLLLMVSRKWKQCT